MRIVLISPSPPLRGGISTHSACLYNELSKNHSVLVISYKKLYPDFLFPGKTQYNNKISSLDIPSDELINSMKFMYENYKLVLEPACVAGVSALLGPLKNNFKNQNTLIILCGSSIDMKTWSKFIN